MHHAQRLGRSVVVATMIVMGACRRGGVPPDGVAHADTLAREFAPGVLSRGHEFMVGLTPDGRAVYVTRRTYDRPTAPPTLAILESRLVDGRWSEPVVAPFSGTWRDIDPVVSPDGNRLYFSSVRPGPGRDSSATDFDIWVVERAGARWGEARRLPPPVNGPGAEYFASETADGALYFTVGGAARGESYIVRARRLAADRWAVPETLAVVNASRNAGNPFVAPDGSYLLFSAQRPEGLGDSDLYLSRREGPGWTAPRNLGPRVNTPLAEFAPSVSPDGRWLYFTRMTRGQAGEPPVREERLMAVPLAAVR